MILQLAEEVPPSRSELRTMAASVLQEAAEGVLDYGVLKESAFAGTPNAIEYVEVRDSDEPVTSLRQRTLQRRPQPSC